MKNNQSGFTLIELIVVVILIAIVAAVAAPRFIDITDEAGEAAIQGIAGNIESASILNSSIDSLVEAGASTDSFQTVDACTLAIANSLLTRPLDAADYSVTGAAAIADKATETCTITGPTGDSANFTLIGAN